MRESRFREQDRTLQAKNEQLTVLNRINEAIRGIDQATGRRHREPPVVGGSEGHEETPGGVSGSSRGWSASTTTANLRTLL